MVLRTPASPEAVPVFAVVGAAAAGALVVDDGDVEVADEVLLALVVGAADVDPSVSVSSVEVCADPGGSAV